ncbi:transposase [Streptomyces sp. NPDC005356]|uniref:transposase n=1 Tax=unclassified Streptomyces TaxID=2593676 RepID=UPI0033A4B39B
MERRAVCPTGKISATWNDVVQKGRQLSLYPRELTEAIRTARAQQQGGTWQRYYVLRAGIEGAIRQATHTTGLRRARYRTLCQDPPRPHHQRPRPHPTPRLVERPPPRPHQPQPPRQTPTLPSGMTVGIGHHHRAVTTWARPGGDDTTVGHV